jgi:hypothetical protein
MSKSRDAFEDDAREAAEAEKRRNTAVVRGTAVVIDGRVVGHVANWKPVARSPAPTHALNEYGERTFAIPGRTSVTAPCTTTVLEGRSFWRPPANPRTPRVKHNGLEWSAAVRFRKDVYCITCVENGALLHSIAFIEADEVWDNYPRCVECGKEHRYVQLDHDVCGGCNPDASACVGLCSHVCGVCGGHPCTCKSPSSGG